MTQARAAVERRPQARPPGVRGDGHHVSGAVPPRRRHGHIHHPDSGRLFAAGTDWNADGERRVSSPDHPPLPLVRPRAGYRRSDRRCCDWHADGICDHRPLHRRPRHSRHRHGVPLGHTRRRAGLRTRRWNAGRRGSDSCRVASQPRRGDARRYSNPDRRIEPRRAAGTSRTSPPGSLAHGPPRRREEPSPEPLDDHRRRARPHARPCVVGNDRHGEEPPRPQLQRDIARGRQRCSERRR